MTRRLATLLASLLATAAGAAQVRHFQLDTPRAMSGATAKGMAVSTDGTLRPLPPLQAVASFEEPLGLALAVAPDGTAYVGTGHPARVWRVRGGAKEMVGELQADQITALLIDPKGTVYAATAVPALLVRLAPGDRKFEVAGTLAEGNLWDLAWFGNAVVAAAGTPGRLMRLGAKGLEKVADVPDTHARCLAVAGDVLYVGTSGKGLVLRWTGQAPIAPLYDSSFTEIAALAAGPDDTVYAVALTGDPTMGRPPAPAAGSAKDAAAAGAAAGGTSGGSGAGDVSVTVSAGPPSTPSTERGPSTSEVLRILPTGAATTAYRFSKQLADALAWNGTALVIGTGLEGELWQLVGSDAAELDVVDAAQVVRLAGGGDWVLTQGPVKLLHRAGAPHGTFTSPALDAVQPAHWGVADVSFAAGKGGSCSIRFRSGATAEPGEAWSDWTPAQPCGSSRVGAPPARYLQWQIELQGGGETRVERTDVAYRQVNLPPEIRDVTVYAPGEVYLKNPPPSDRIVEVQHPDLSGIFTTMDDDSPERQATLGKRYYRVGYQTVSWRVEDPNGDPLRFTLELQRQGEDRWTPVREDLDTTVLAVDTHALADGVYRFRVSASDAAGNPAKPSSAHSVSSMFTVDNTPPRVTVTRQGSEWVVVAEDALSPIAIAEWNRDADEWHPAAEEDGTVGSRTQKFRIPAATGRHTLGVRVVDDHHNVTTVAVEENQ